MSFVLYGVFLAHVMAYKEQYAHIGIMFSITVIMKVLAKVAGAKDQSDLITVGGGALTASEFLKLLQQMTSRGITGGIGGAKASSEGGLLGDIIESVKGLVTK